MKIFVFFIVLVVCPLLAVADVTVNLVWTPDQDPDVISQEIWQDPDTNIAGDDIRRVTGLSPGASSASFVYTGQELIRDEVWIRTLYAGGVAHDSPRVAPVCIAGATNIIVLPQCN